MHILRQIIHQLLRVFLNPDLSLELDELYELLLLKLLLNEQYATSESNLVIDLSIEKNDGKVLCSAQEMFANVPENARIEKSITINIPSNAQAGDYQLHSRLLRGKSVINEIVTPLLIMTKNKPALTTSWKIALYDQKSKDKDSTRQLLDELAIPFTLVNDLNGIDKYEMLIIGKDSMNPALAKIRGWLERGGKILCFEQSKADPVPFIKEMSYKSANKMLFADVINTVHPVLSGIKPQHWEVWNGECIQEKGAVDAGPKAIYQNIVIPMPKGVIISGANRGFEPTYFGMVVGEVKVGNGLVLFSQPLATTRYGKDPVATVYLNNLLKYALSKQWNGEFAQSIK
jgi:hypothetical protein